MIPFDATGAFQPVAEGRELRRLAVKGAAATVSASALAVAAQFVSTVILARLLTPADFGVVTMVTTFSMLLMGFGVNGFEEAVIQRVDINRFQASNLLDQLRSWVRPDDRFAAAGSLASAFLS